MKARWIWVAAAVVFAVSAADEREVRAKGREIVAAATATLSTNLMKAITNGGFTNAISFCSVHALPLTEAAATNPPAAVLRRVALKVRNPANAPDAIDRRVMERYTAVLGQGQTPVPAVEELNGETRYYEPILIQNPLCLNCHGRPGEQVRRETLDLIRKLYPEDAATGFAMNELRGAWSVTFKKAGK